LVISEIILFLNTETIVILLQHTVGCVYVDCQLHTVHTRLQKQKIEMEGHNVTDPKQYLHCIYKKCSTEQNNTEQYNRYQLTTATEQFCYFILIVRAMMKVILMVTVRDWKDSDWQWGNCD
jgi:deoxyadenosine/deoxycytidine kinase